MRQMKYSLRRGDFVAEGYFEEIVLFHVVGKRQVAQVLPPGIGAQAVHGKDVIYAAAVQCGYYCRADKAG